MDKRLGEKIILLEESFPTRLGTLSGLHTALETTTRVLSENFGEAKSEASLRLNDDDQTGCRSRSLDEKGGRMHSSVGEIQ